MSNKYSSSAEILRVFDGPTPWLLLESHFTPKVVSKSEKMRFLRTPKSSSK